MIITYLVQSDTVLGPLIGPGMGHTCPAQHARQGRDVMNPPAREGQGIKWQRPGKYKRRKCLIKSLKKEKTKEATESGKTVMCKSWPNQMVWQLVRTQRGLTLFGFRLITSH